MPDTTAAHPAPFPQASEPAPRPWWRRLTREPLVHFLAIGLVLFAIFDLFGGRQGTNDNRIVVDDAVVADLSGRFAGTWQRPPTRAELDRLIADHVRDEIFYRQGAAMGLLDDDPVIRRRVRQKLEVLAEESQGGGGATDAELQAYLARHADKYAQPLRQTFEQVYFDPRKHGPALPAAIAAARASLDAGADPATVGDASLLPDHADMASTRQIAADFGEAFAGQLAAHPTGKWTGPIGSVFGQHLVRITAREAADAPRLADVRGQVERDWEIDRRLRNSAAYYAKLRKDYDVTIRFAPTATTGTAAR